MIKRSEIRVRNIYSAKGEPLEVVEFEKTGVPRLRKLNQRGTPISEFLVEQLEPVELDEKWLRRLKVLPGNNRIAKVFCVGDFRIVTEGTTSDGSIPARQDVPRKVRKEIKYVHELQNLYAILFDEELLYEGDLP